ncbi:MAG: DEAD/DEAH box helicase family protein [Lachnospiraceae bacterium]|nr:MAG: DEAD/DEAH box helicase family protein [Lachnospiraceae bacterium]
MFNGRLCDFQTEHEENLLNKCADHEEMVLYAPTGSGKTVMVCKFIDDYLDENPDTVFLWLCPGAGGLHKQSQDSFDEFTTGIPYGDVYSFISEPDPKGQVFFINWDKINSASNVVLKEGEHKDFMSKIYECHNSNIDIFMLIDEEHKYRDTANKYVANIHPVHVLRISATPVTVLKLLSNNGAKMISTL